MKNQQVKEAQEIETAQHHLGEVQGEVLEGPRPQIKEQNHKGETLSYA